MNHKTFTVGQRRWEDSGSLGESKGSGLRDEQFPS